MTSIRIGWASCLKRGGAAMTPGSEDAWIGVLGVIGAGIIGAGGALLGSRLSRRAARDQIAANSVDIGKQIEASSADVRAQIAGAEAATEAQIAAVRAEKVQEEKRSAYKELSAYLLYMEAKRELDARPYRLNEEGEAALQRSLGVYQPPDWWELQARIAQYGSEAVIAQLRASRDADQGIEVAATKLAELEFAAKSAQIIATMPRAAELPAKPGGEIVLEAARKKDRDAMEHAQETGQELIKLMRDELNPRS
jgi:hypothetical protein